MLCACIKLENGKQKYIKLDDGINKFGSDPECNFILRGHDFEKVQFSVLNTETGATIETYEEDTPGIFKIDGHSPQLSPHLIPYKITPDSVISVGKLEIDFKGNNLTNEIDADPVDNIEKPRAKKGKLLIYSTIAVVFCLSIFARILPASAHLNSVNTVSVSQSETGIPPIENTEQTTDIIPSNLERISISDWIDNTTDGHIHLDESQGLPKVTAYFPNRAEANSFVNTLIDAYPFVDVSIYSDDNIKTLSEESIHRIDESITLHSVDLGSVILQSFLDMQHKEDEIRKILTENVPSIREVSFVYKPLSPDFKERIVGIWTGSTPYLMLEDGKMIREGYLLTDGVIVQEIEKEALVLASATLTLKEQINE